MLSKGRKTSGVTARSPIWEMIWVMISGLQIQEEASTLWSGHIQVAMSKRLLIAGY